MQCHFSLGIIPNVNVAATRTSELNGGDRWIMFVLKTIRKLKVSCECETSPSFSSAPDVSPTAFYPMTPCPLLAMHLQSLESLLCYSFYFSVVIISAFVLCDYSLFLIHRKCVS